MGAVVASTAALACSIAVRRDFATVAPGTVGYDDMCSLQEYFDTIEAKGAEPPTLVNSVDLEAQNTLKPVRGGRARFAFEGDFQLKHLRRMLNENWRRLPDELASAQRIDVEVKWTERAGAKRVVTDEDAELAVGPQSWSLPYQICLSELLYGEPLYRQRRLMWGLPMPAVNTTPNAAKTTVTVEDTGPPPPSAEATPDAGVAPAGDVPTAADAGAGGGT
jgi:hypothetical protein